MEDEQQETFFTTHSPEETQELAGRVLRDLFEKEKGLRSTSTIIALQGDLGAGKTVFTKGIAHALGVGEMVTSPTFVLQKTYAIPEGAPWKTLVHIDAYRLEDEKELSAIGWRDTATNPYNLIVMEWPENIALALPMRALWVNIEQVGEEERKIVIGE